MLKAPIRLTADGSGLRGDTRLHFEGTETIIEAEGLHGLTLRGFTLIRETDSPDNRQAIQFDRCSQVTLDSVRVENNRSVGPTIRLVRCTDNRIVNCSILNYKQMGLNIRPTQTFRTIDGHGMALQHCWGSLIQGNSIIERRLLADEATMEKHELGKVLEGVSPVEGMPDFFPAWHQGAGIGSFRGAHSVIVGNYVENACQGFDFQTDQSVLNGNIVRGAQSGIKCMQFTENVIISYNNISYTDLWGIVMAPGQTAKPPEAGDEDIRAENPTHYGDDKKIENPTQLELLERAGLGLVRAEVNSGTIISNNVFSHFGEGPEYFNWPPVLHIDDGFLTVINLWGQWEDNKKTSNVTFHPDSGMRSILVQGNMIYHSGQDGVIEEGKTIYPEPKYRYAVYRNTGPYGPRQVFLSGNLLHSGKDGVSNLPLNDQEKTLNMIVERSAED